MNKSKSEWKRIMHISLLPLSQQKEQFKFRRPNFEISSSLEERGTGWPNIKLSCTWWAILTTSDITVICFSFTANAEIKIPVEFEVIANQRWIQLPLFVRDWLCLVAPTGTNSSRAEILAPSLKGTGNKPHMPMTRWKCILRPSVVPLLPHIYMLNIRWVWHGENNLRGLIRTPAGSS